MISRLSLGLPFYVSVQLFKCISGKNSRILLYFIGDERLWDNGLHGVPVLVHMLEIRKVVSDCLIIFFWDKYNEWVTSRQSSVVMRTTNEIIFYFHHPRVSEGSPVDQNARDGNPNITEVFLSTVQKDVLLQISIIQTQCPVEQSMLSSLLLSTICYTVNDFWFKHCIVH